MAVATDGPALSVEWWECGSDGQPVFAGVMCSGCISQYHLPPSPASLEDPNLPDDVPSHLFTPICMRCFETWRTTRGMSVGGNYPGAPSPAVCGSETVVRHTESQPDSELKTLELDAWLRKVAANSVTAAPIS
jgi:hypothetical protein